MKQRAMLVVVRCNNMYNFVNICFVGSSLFSIINSVSILYLLSKGVYGLYFDNDGQVVDYKALLTGTTW